jgi:hypothetical protein
MVEDKLKPFAGTVYIAKSRAQAPILRTIFMLVPGSVCLKNKLKPDLSRWADLRRESLHFTIAGGSNSQSEPRYLPSATFATGVQGTESGISHAEDLVGIYRSPRLVKSGRWTGSGTDQAL